MGVETKMGQNLPIGFYEAKGNPSSSTPKLHVIIKPS
jgi:hypothetical protein